MKNNTAEKLHFDAVHLSVLLRTLHTALPDDLAHSSLDTRFIIGWALQMAEALADGLDGLEATTTSKTATTPSSR